MPHLWEIAVVLLAAGVALAIPIAALTLSMTAFVRTRRIRQLELRLERLETAIRGETALPPRREEGQPAAPTVMASAGPESPPVRLPGAPRTPFQWEAFIGQRAFGWAAIVLLVFAAAFFLRYAYENNWIGPLGRVAIGALVGILLVLAGFRLHRRGSRVFSQMLSAGGMVVLYLAAYSAFGFYHLLPQSHAGFFLALIVAESMVAAALYGSLGIALMAVLGGLLTPLLMHTDQDSYSALFTYLAVLEAGVALLTLLRVWPVVASLALLGGQALFWLWYGENYHPEKLAWALGFQLAVYLIFLVHSLAAQAIRPGRENWEGPLRLVLNAFLFFAALYVLAKADYGDWMGIAAVCMAILYVVAARAGLAGRARQDRHVLACLSVAVGFIALAFPIQADASWVALGWAAMAGALWWFGQRIASPPLRGIAAALAFSSVLRLVCFDIHHRVAWPFLPLLNEFALPSIGVTVCILAALTAARRRLRSCAAVERSLTAVAGLTAILLLWLVLSIDCYRYFDAQAALPDVDSRQWRWLGQLSLSVLWAVYATVLLAIGFRGQLAQLRWLAIAIYAATVVKVFLVDMAELQQVYRILAFFILAVFLGLAARAYQRLRPMESRAGSLGAQHDST